MALVTSFLERCRQPEIMDQPGLDEPRHVHALWSLERFNRWSRSSRILWPAIREFGRANPGRAVRVLDIATGGGDIPIALCKRAMHENLALEIDGCDCSDRAVAYAQHRSQEQQTEVRFFHLNVLTDPIPDSYDVLTASLFLHHLTNDQVVDVLERMAEKAHMIIINDLRRGLAAWIFAYIGTRLLSTSDVVHVDGPLSVRAAFSLREIRALANAAGLKGAVVKPRWPFRFVLTWRR